MLIVKKNGCPYCIDFEKNVEPTLRQLVPFESKWIGPGERETLWFGKVRCRLFPCILLKNSNGMVRQLERPRGTGEEQAKAIASEWSQFQDAKDWRLRHGV